MPSIDISRHANHKVGQLIIDALNIKPDGFYPALIPLYETDVQRLKFTVKHKRSLIEVALDQGMVVSDGRSAVLCELEIELKQGKPKHAIDFARTWCATYGLWLSTISKPMKGQRLHDGLLSGQLSHETHQPKRYVNGKHMVKVVFQSCLNQILTNASEIGSGSQKADHTHQLRVGIRRLRTAMRELNILVDGIDPAWEAPLIDAFRALGQQRDDNYVTRELQPQIAAIGAPTVNTQRIEANMLDPGLVVRSEPFQGILLSIMGYVHSSYLTVLDDEKVKYRHQKVTRILAKNFGKLHANITKEGKKFLALNETQQHSVRKHFKRLRYLAEFSVPLYSGSPSKKKRINTFISGLKPVQDALGFYNDELTALQIYRKLAVKDKRAWFGAGWLSARRKNNAKNCQQEIDVFIKKFNEDKLFWQ